MGPKRIETNGPNEKIKGIGITALGKTKRYLLYLPTKECCLLRSS